MKPSPSLGEDEPEMEAGSASVASTQGRSLHLSPASSPLMRSCSQSKPSPVDTGVPVDVDATRPTPIPSAPVDAALPNRRLQSTSTTIVDALVDVDGGRAGYLDLSSCSDAGDAPGCLTTDKEPLRHLRPFRSKPPFDLCKE